MVKRKGRRRKKLKILVSFEPSRLGRAALEEAYERISPSRKLAAKGLAGISAFSAAVSGYKE